MAFSYPTYLWALLGLLIPIAIHLWNKKEGKTIQVGSIENFKTSESKQTNSLKLNELALLFLRLLIITLIVFIIAEPFYKTKAQIEPITYMVEPSILSDAKVVSVIDSLNTNYPVQLLQENFPDYNGSQLQSTTTQPPNYWQLAKQMETLPTDSIVIFTRGLASGIKGKRPEINKKIDWIIVDDEQSPIVEIPLRATKKADSIDVLIAETNDQFLQFNKVRLSRNSKQIELNSSKNTIQFVSTKDEMELPIIKEDTIKILMYYQSSFSVDMKYIRSSYKAISKYLDREISINVVEDTMPSSFNNQNVVVWLSEERIPEIKTTLLQYQPNNFSNTLIEKGKTSNLYYLTGHINSEKLLNEHLAQQLMDILKLDAGLIPALEEIDKRVLSSNELMTTYKERTNVKNNIYTFSLSNWFWLALILVLFSERFMAYYRKQ